MSEAVLEDEEEITVTPEECHALCVTSPRYWFGVFGVIRDEHGKLIGGGLDDNGIMVTNALQNAFFDAFEHLFLGMDEDLQPTTEGPQIARIIVLKPRKSGMSTVAQATLYWMHRRFESLHFQSQAMAQDYETSDELRDMFGRFAEYDSFKWPRRAEVRRNHGSFKIGLHGMSRRATALSPGAGRGKTPNAAHYTEAAHYPSEGKRDATTMMLGRLESIPLVSGSIVIAESTPDGASGWFYDTYDGAVSLEEWKRGKRGNGWVKVFEPWYRFEKHVLPVVTVTEANLTPMEKRCINDYGCTFEQIEWRRAKVISCGSEDRFLQEYCQEEESAFLSSGRPFFETGALHRFRQRIKTIMEEDLDPKPRYGKLDGSGVGLIRFLPVENENEAEITIWHLPPVKKSEIRWKFLAVADTATGADVVKDSRVSDRHSVFIIRAGAVDVKTGKWYPPCIVARINPPFQDSSIQAVRRLVQLAEFYGRCTIVVEANGPGLAWLRELNDHVQYPNIYRRQVQDTNTMEWKEQLGWMTTAATRRLPLDKFDDMVRRDQCEFFCPNLLAEMQTFVYHADGKPAGAVGRHDDDVMSAALGFYLVHDHATPFEP